MAYTVDRDGFEILPGVLDQPVVTALCEAVARPESSESVRARSGVYAIRNLLAEAPAVRELARSERLLDFVRPTLGQHARAVKATLFDKRPGANWLVPWHQDLTITVQSRRDVPGFGPWTLKAGVVNVQPPASVLEQVLALRIHLDDCDCDNGALRVLPGSHREGRLTAACIEAWRRGCTEVPCPVPRGGAFAHAAAATARVLACQFARSSTGDPYRIRSRRPAGRARVARLSARAIFGLMADRRLTDVGGTPGGLGHFLIGLAMACVGGYLLTNQVMVQGAYWNFYGAGTFGITLIPMLIGVGVLFRNGRSLTGWLLTVAGLLFILTGVLTNLHIYFQPTSLFNTLVMLVLLVGGLGLIVRALWPYRTPAP